MTSPDRHEAMHREAELLLAQARASLVNMQTFYRRVGVEPLRMEQLMEDIRTGALRSRLLDVLDTSSGAEPSTVSDESRPPLPSVSAASIKSPSPRKRKLRVRV